MRDEVKGFKRDRILEAATQLFYERGFTGTTMQAVADRLQVTKPFIYSYFKDKNALLAAIYDRSTEPLMRGLDQILEGDEPLAARFSEFIEQFAHLNMQYRIVSTIFLREETHLGKEAQRKLRNFEHSFDAKLTKLISAWNRCRRLQGRRRAAGVTGGRRHDPLDASMVPGRRPDACRRDRPLHGGSRLERRAMRARQAETEGAGAPIFRPLRRRRSGTPPTRVQPARRAGACTIGGLAFSASTWKPATFL